MSCNSSKFLNETGTVRYQTQFLGVEFYGTSELGPSAFSIFTYIKSISIHIDPVITTYNWSVETFDGPSGIDEIYIENMYNIFPTFPIPSAHPWKAIQAAASKGLRTLTVQYCQGDNRMTNGIFAKFRDLQLLEIAYGTITQIDQDVFIDLADNLRQLWISNGALKQLQKRMFAPLVNLLRLDLPYNDLVDFNEKRVFENLTKLESLNFYGNNITAAILADRKSVV